MMPDTSEAEPGEKGGFALARAGLQDGAQAHNVP